MGFDRSRRAFWRLWLLGAVIALTGARSGRFDHVVRGTVKAEDGHPIEAAEVTTDLPGERAVSGADGAFLLATKSPGQNIILHAKAVGFSPETQSVSFQSADTIVVSFSLKPVAQKLPSVEVTGTPTYTSAKMIAFEERRKTGIGRFFTREMLAQRENSVLTDVLRMTPGLSFVRRPDKCGGGFALATGRGGFVNRLDWMHCEGDPYSVFPIACYLAIYMDGVRVWAPGQTEPPNIDQVASIVSLEAIELYRGPSETPIMYQNTGSTCGTVLLWTRTGEKG